MNTLLLAALVVAAPPVANQTQTAEPFSVAKDPCSRWTTEMQLHGLVRQRFTSWLEGMLIGRALTARTPLPTIDDTLHAREWLDDFCEAHPEVKMDKAAAALLDRPKSH